MVSQPSNIIKTIQYNTVQWSNAYFIGAFKGAIVLNFAA